MTTLATGAAILLEIRSHPGISWEQLCERFGLPLDHADSLQYSLERQVAALVNAGLVTTVQSSDGGSPMPRITFTVSESWPQIQSALGVSLVQMAQLQHGKTLIVKPYFGSPVCLTPSPDVFVLMPFTLAMKPLYDDHIATVVKRMGLSVSRADDFYFARAIITDIWAAACTARVIIADCTDRNPNVFYEIGLAHAIGKSVILITRNADDIPFDLRYIRYLQYEYSPSGMKQFESKLEEMLRAELSSPEATREHLTSTSE